MDKCERCNQEYKLSFSDKLYKKQIEYLSIMFPALHTVIVNAENYCPSCYKETVEPSAQELAKGLIK